MVADVREKLRSIFRFLGLAAFILGPLWYLLIVATRGLWISGMIGLTLALVGYVTIRLVDEEKGWKGAVRRAARWAAGKIQTWPFWLQGGLLSLVLAATMYYVGSIASGLLDIFGLTIFVAPVMSINILPLKGFNPSIFLIGLWFYISPVGFWFLLGSLLGKVTESSGRRYWAFLILWFVIFATLVVAVRLYFLTL